MDNSRTQIKQEAGSSGFMKKNESNLEIYEQLRIAAWWGKGRLLDGSKGLGGQLGRWGCRGLWALVPGSGTLGEVSEGTLDKWDKWSQMWGRHFLSIRGRGHLSTSILIQFSIGLGGGESWLGTKEKGGIGSIGMLSCLGGRDEERGEGERDSEIETERQTNRERQEGRERQKYRERGRAVPPCSVLCTLLVVFHVRAVLVPLSASLVP